MKVDRHTARTLLIRSQLRDPVHGFRVGLERIAMSVGRGFGNTSCPVVKGEAASHFSMLGMRSIIVSAHNN